MELPRLVLLPGMDGTGDLFEPLIQAIGAQAVLDVARYPTQRPLSYDELEDLVRPQLPAGPFVLLGESFSGPLAVSLAAARPPGLLGVVLCCSFVRNPRPALTAFAGLLSAWPLRRMSVMPMLPPARHLLLGRFGTPQLAQLLAGALGKVSPAVMVHRAQQVLRIHVADKLRTLRVPVLYLQAAQDRVVPTTAARFVQQVLPATRVVRLEGPHCLLQASPAEAATALLSFCQGLVPTRSA